MRSSLVLRVPFLLMTIAASGIGQQVAPGPAAAPPLIDVAPLPPPDPAAIIVALSEMGDRLSVPVSIAGSKPYPFVIDTGAERTVVSRELAQVLALEPGPRVHLTAVTRSSLVDTVIVPSLAMSTIEAGQITAPALAGYDLGAPGILGIDALQSRKVLIDFVHRRMAVKPSLKRRHTPAALPNEIVVEARNLFGQLILTQAHFGGQSIEVVIDTGSAMSIGNSAFRDLLSRASHPAADVSMLDVTGGALTTNCAVINHLMIGDVGFDNLPVAFADIAPFKRFGLSDEPALLLGMDALRAFRSVTIDFANRQVRFLMPSDEELHPGQWTLHI